jgi:hypothetical protein
MGKKVLLPKTKCCVSATRCERCPIRMLKEGTLPSGYGVHKRQLVRLDADGKRATKVKKVKKADVAAALRQQIKNEKSRKKSGRKKSNQKKLVA